MRRSLVALLTMLCACQRSAMPRPARSDIPIGARAVVLQGDGVRLRAFEWPGSGTPLVLLHGLGGNAATWTSFARQVAGRHVIAVDLPGHGESPVALTWDFAPMARQILGAVQGRWPGAHIWVGHSWGGKLAVAVAALDSAETRGLVLVDAVQASALAFDPPPFVERLFAGELDPWPTLDSALASASRLPQYSPWTPDVALAFRRAVTVQPDGRVVPLLARGKAVAIMATFAQDLSGSANVLRIPVLVLSQPKSPFEGAQRKLFPTATYVTVEGNHWLQISNVSATSNAVTAWLQQHHL